METEKECDKRMEVEIGKVKEIKAILTGSLCRVWQLLSLRISMFGDIMKKGIKM